MIDISELKQFFPLYDFEHVENLFAYNLDKKNGEPNLAFLSIVAGLIEHSCVHMWDRNELVANSRPIPSRKDLAQGKTASSRLVNSSSHNIHDHSHQLGDSASCEFNEAGHVVSCSGDSSDRSSICSSPDYNSNDNLKIPEIDFGTIEDFYKQFVDQIKGKNDPKSTEPRKTNLKIKEISDIVWKHLSNNYYKDKRHLQNLYSYITTNKLDCFGLSIGVIAACQILNIENIYLALSEDHTWVMYELSEEELRNPSRQKEIQEYKLNGVPIPSCALYGTCEVTWHGKASSDKRGQPVSYKNCWLHSNGYAVKCDARMCVAAIVKSIDPTMSTNTDSELLALLQQRLLWGLFDRKIYYPMSLGHLGELEDLCPTPNAPVTSHQLYNLGIEIARTEYNNSHVYPYTYLASYFLKCGRYKETFETWADSSAVMPKYNYSRDDEEIYKEFFEVANELIPSMLKNLSAGGLEPGKSSLKPILQDPECLGLILMFYDNICCWEEGSSTPVLHIGWAKSFVATVSKFSSIIRGKIKLFTEEEWLHNKANASECEVASSKTDQCSSTFSENHLDRQDLSPSDSLSAAGSVKDSGHRLGETSAAVKLETYDVDTEDSVDSAEHTNEETSSTTISLINGSNRARTREKSASSRAKRKRFKSFDRNEQACSSPKQQQVDGNKSDHHSVWANDEPQSSRKRYEVAPERRLELDNENNVAVILRSRKIAGVRDLLQAERLNKNTIELQLSAQSECAPRGRSNSNSAYSSDFISSALVSLNSGSTTRSKRLHR